MLFIATGNVIRCKALAIRFLCATFFNVIRNYKIFVFPSFQFGASENLSASIKLEVGCLIRIRRYRIPTILISPGSQIICECIQHNRFPFVYQPISYTFMRLSVVRTHFWRHFGNVSHRHTIQSPREHRASTNCVCLRKMLILAFYSLCPHRSRLSVSVQVSEVALSFAGRTNRKHGAKNPISTHHHNRGVRVFLHLCVCV